MILAGVEGTLGLIDGALIFRRSHEHSNQRIEGRFVNGIKMYVNIQTVFICIVAREHDLQGEREKVPLYTYGFIHFNSSPPPIHKVTGMVTCLLEHTTFSF